MGRLPWIRVPRSHCLEQDISPRKATRLRFSHERPGHHRRHAREGSSPPRLAPRPGLRLRRLLRRRRFGLHRLRRGRRARRRPRARRYRPQCELSGQPLHPAEVGAEIERSPSGTPEPWHAGRWPSCVSGRVLRSRPVVQDHQDRVHCGRQPLQPHAVTAARGREGDDRWRRRGRRLLPRPFTSDLATSSCHTEILRSRPGVLFPNIRPGWLVDGERSRREVRSVCCLCAGVPLSARTYSSWAIAPGRQPLGDFATIGYSPRCTRSRVLTSESQWFCDSTPAACQVPCYQRVTKYRSHIRAAASRYPRSGCGANGGVVMTALTCLESRPARPRGPSMVRASSGHEHRA
jgi:hypothetical protein